MDLETSREVVRATFRSSRELEDLIPILKVRCPEDEYQTFARAIATVIAESGLQILNRVFAEHPELEAEVDTAIAESGHY